VDAVSGLLPFVLILVAFYFLIVRPARNRQKAALELQQRLAPGVEVMTTSGIYGTVVGVDDTTIQLEIAPSTTVRVAKPAVGQVLAADTADDPAEGGHGSASPAADGTAGGAGTSQDGDANDSRDDRSTR
jgi:preprotein translocase subunit YajC